MSLVIVGVSTRAIAQSACRAGYDVRTVDFFGDYDQKLCCPNVSLRRDLGRPLSAWSFLDAAFSGGGACHDTEGVVYLANLENHPEVIAAFERRTHVLGNGAQTVAAVRRWEAVATCLAGCGIRTPHTVSSGALPAAGRWLVKPRRSGGGHGVRFWDGESLRPGWVLQEYVPGIPCSVSFVADGQRAVLLGASEQLLGCEEFGAGGFRYCGNIFPLHAASAGAADLLARLQQMVDAIIDRFRLAGVGGVDFVLSDGDAVPVEVNPRYTGAMELIERATGVSIFDAHMRALDADLPREMRTVDGYWGKAIVFARRNGVVRCADRWLERGVCDVPVDGEELSTGHPVCTVIARGRTRDACFATLVAKAREIEEDLDER